MVLCLEILHVTVLVVANCRRILNLHLFFIRGMLPQFERLISLENDLGGETSPTLFARVRPSAQDIDDEISRLKSASTSRFKEKWEQILEKYAAIDDNLESDEIDLETGKITIDNGHLRSMVPNEIVVGGVKVNGDIWAEDDSYDKAYNDQRRVKAHQEKLRQRFEGHIRRHREGSPLTKDAIPDDNLHLAFSSPSKRSYSRLLSEQPSSLALSQSEDSDFSDTNPSPFRVSQAGSLPSSPLKRSTSISPTKRHQRTPHWFNCAFEYCPFMTEEKLVYEDHLLSDHCNELSFIGYPVKGDESKVKRVITELCTRKLALHFPLNIDSAEQNSSRIGYGRICPILGCEFQATKAFSLGEHGKDLHYKRIARTGIPFLKSGEANATISKSSPEKEQRLDLKTTAQNVQDDEEEEEEDAPNDSQASFTMYPKAPEAPPFKILEDGPEVDEKNVEKKDGYDSIDEFFND